MFDRRRHASLASVLIASIAGVGGGLGAPLDLEGQSVDALVTSCTGGGGLADQCARWSTASAWITTGAGLIASASTASPDLHRTVGRRTPGGPPRTGFDVRVAFAPLAHPDLTASGSGIVDRTQLSVGLGAVIGLYEGLQPYPSIGGVFSLDALLGYTWVPLPTDIGYEGSANVRTFGARVGLLRESFSAPGIAATVLRSLGDPVIYTGSDGVVTVDPSTTTTRLAIGKDLLGVGLHAAIGRDWIGSDVRMGGISDGADGVLIVDGKLDRTRTVAQAGASLNYLVLRVQADAGWAFGAGGNEGPQSTGLDSGGSLFGSLAVRLIL